MEIKVKFFNWFCKFLLTMYINSVSFVYSKLKQKLLKIETIESDHSPKIELFCTFHSRVMKREQTKQNKKISENEGFKWMLYVVKNMKWLNKRASLMRFRFFFVLFLDFNFVRFTRWVFHFLFDATSIVISSGNALLLSNLNMNIFVLGLRMNCMRSIKCNASRYIDSYKRNALS